VAVPGHALEGVPIVVLVDRETASAAELLAGALRERAGATLVGERTYGKGLSQALESDPKAGVSWQVTQSAWTLPSGAKLETVGGVRRGLAPDVEVALTTAERFQVRGMRAEREALRSHQDSSPVPSRAIGVRADLPRLSADPQLEAALRIARGATPAAGGSAPPPSP
jgi:C-terminal processing protease CtpA/Prc